MSKDSFYSEENIRYLESIKRDLDEGKAHFAEHALIDDTQNIKNYHTKGNRKHDGVWYWFDVVDSMDGGWEEYDEPLRRALEEIEQLPGLPADFIIDYIKEKEGVGLRLEFENAGPCNQAVCAIRNRVEDETRPIMVAKAEMVAQAHERERMQKHDES